MALYLEEFDLFIRAISLFSLTRCSSLSGAAAFFLLNPLSFLFPFLL